MKNLIVEPITKDTTIGEYLTRDLKIGPRAALKEAFLQKKVLLNGSAVKRTALIKSGDHIQLRSDAVGFLEDLAIIPNEKLNLKVLLENDAVIVVDKSSGEFTNPQRPSESDTTLNGLVARYPETAYPARENLPLEGLMVHRLDCGTSGLLVAARSIEVFNELRERWSKREVEKVYLTWVHGELTEFGEARLFLSHDPKNKKRMLVSAQSPTSKNEAHWAARTTFEPLFSTGKQTLVLVRIFSGVTHQIRATLSSFGHSVIGDPIYMSSTKKPKIPFFDLFTKKPLLHEMDPETRALFTKLKRLLPEFSEVSELNLPARGFFLHAVWLRVAGVETLEKGVLCPPPAYFG